MTLTSTGIGVRMDIEKIFTLALDYGYVLNPGLTGDRGNSRIHIRAALTF
jgi:hemolysin activation/secretion protein